MEELSAATTKLTETEQQVKTAQENMALAEENLDLVTFSYNEGRASMVDVLSAQLRGRKRKPTLSTRTLPQKWQWPNTGKPSVNKGKRKKECVKTMNGFSFCHS